MFVIVFMFFSFFPAELILVGCADREEQRTCGESPSPDSRSVSYNFISFLVWPSVTSRYGKSFLAVHRCTAGNPARGYAENAERTVDYADLTE